ncbi:MAG TPA: DUF3857 and transglutaminase domain-containing protein [Bacteroidales bacterium]|nr:DUF3857 and transglutaminase domain-containing protein [Bacteroidales bacterium]
MKRIAITIIFALNVLIASSQFYVFDSIPENLKKRADAVVRSEQCLYTIEQPGHAVMKVRKAVTLMNENADIFRYLSVDYNKFSKINYLRGTIYDEKGEIVKVLGMSDVFDMSAISGGDFYSDERLKIMYFPLYRYPYTIEYEYEKTYTSTMSFAWAFQSLSDVSVQKSGIQFIIPANMNLRYFEKDLLSKVDTMVIDGKKTYTWQEENLPAFHSQDLSISQVYRIPFVQAAPKEFEYGGVRGSMSSWKDFGDWCYKINKDRDQLPESVMADARELVKGISDPVEKIRKIYEYVQAGTRYVSIQIGIGGYQSALASDVSKYGYGDCKALVNYTHALLKSVGIESFFALAYAGTPEDIETSFVVNQFNHVILCVPLAHDSIWLECTSKTFPSNFLGSTTAGKHVLLLTSDGGKLVKTPSIQKNLRVRTGSLYMNVFGAVSGKLNEEFRGRRFEAADAVFSFESQEDIMKTLHSSLRFNDFTVKSAAFKEVKYPDPYAELNYELNIKNFGSLNGQRIYFNPGISLNDYLQKLPVELEIYYSETLRDSIAYTLPLNFRIEYIPENCEVNTEFGKFKYSLETIKDKIIFKRTFTLYKMKIPAEKYDSLRSFVNAIAATDSKKVILSRVTGS